MAKMIVASSLLPRLQQTIKILWEIPQIFLFPFFTYFTIFAFSFFLAFLEHSYPSIYSIIPFSLTVTAIFVLLIIALITLPAIGVLTTIASHVKGTKISLKKVISSVKDIFFPFIRILLRFFFHITWIPFIFLILSIISYFIFPLFTTILIKISEFSIFLSALIQIPKIFASLPMVIEHKLSAKEAIQSAKEMSKGHWWNIFGNFLIIFFLSSSVGYIVYVIEKQLFNFLKITPSIEFSFAFFIQGIIGVSLQTFFIGFILSYLFLLYKFYTTKS